MNYTERAFKIMRGEDVPPLNLSKAAIWLEMSKRMMEEQKVREIEFRKLGATKKCAKRMARRAVLAQKNKNSSLFRNLKEWDEKLSNRKKNNAPVHFVW